MNEGKASKPTEKSFKRSGFSLWLRLSMQYDLEVLFLKLTYHKYPEPDPLHTHRLCLASLPFPHLLTLILAFFSPYPNLESGERESFMKHIRTHGPKRRQRASYSSTSRGSPSVRLSLSAWRCQKSWKEAIQRSQTYPPS